MTGSSPMDALVAEASAHFIRRYGRPATWAAQAPGRVNLIGDHTDHAGGLVLPMALDRRVVLLAAPAAGPRSRMGSTTFDGEASMQLSTAGAGAAGPFARLIGVAALVRREGLDLPELDLLLHADLPAGAGLSSSAAIEVGFSVLLDSIAQRPVDPIATARRCRAAEHEFAGVPCGIMDPLVIVAARAGHALLIDCRSLEREQIALPANLATLVVVTDRRRDLSEGAYAERRASVLAAAERVAARDEAFALRDVDEASPRLAALPEPLRRRARHVVSENRRVRASAAALRAGDLERFGALLFESHASLRDDFQVSTPELDAVVAAAESARPCGALGARLTGAGFGGAAIVAVRREALGAVREALARGLETAGVRASIIEGEATDCAAAMAIGGG
ncbi:MAG TPA: galactokinase [Phycisphaerales bacterium]|nr:galactokinase [Phycisphaerales bacterium]HMP36140.1 galactokinase [Phycisphaerales bacterium]